MLISACHQQFHECLNHIHLSKADFSCENHQLHFVSIFEGKTRAKSYRFLTLVLFWKIRINLGNILHHKSVKSKIPPYFKDQSVPIISYAYTIPIATKIFNCKHVLHDLNIDDVKSKPPGCTCANSPFIYNPTGHVITIINNTLLQDVGAYIHKLET